MGMGVGESFPEKAACAKALGLEDLKGIQRVGYKVYDTGLQSWKSPDKTGLYRSAQAFGLTLKSREDRPEYERHA